MDDLFEEASTFTEGRFMIPVAALAFVKNLPESVQAFLLDKRGPVFGPLSEDHLHLWQQGYHSDDDHHDRRLLSRMAAGQAGERLH